MEENFWVQGADAGFDAASSPSSAYNDDAPSYVSIVVGAQSTALPFRTALTGSRSSRGDGVGHQPLQDPQGLLPS
jgi:hypothetical protein